MKIVQVRKDFQPPAKDSQGAGRVIEGICRGLIKLGHDVTLVVDKLPTEPYDIPVSLKIPKCDLIHFHGWNGPDHNYDFYNTPWVATPHCGGMETDPVWLASANNNPHIICVSKFVQDRLNCHAHIWTCSDPSQFIFEENKDDYFLWMNGTDWGESKALFTTIRLAKKLKFKLIIAGSGKNQQIIEAIKTNCDDRVSYVGSVNGVKKAKILSKAKALILLTQVADACPTTVGEAMLSGTPVIGSTNGAMPELINEKVGFICKNDADFTKALMKLKTIKPKDCYEYGLNNFSNEVSAKKHLKYYSNMLKFGKV